MPRNPLSALTFALALAGSAALPTAAEARRVCPGDTHLAADGQCRPNRGAWREEHPDLAARAAQSARPRPGAASAAERPAPRGGTVLGPAKRPPH